MYHGRLAPSPTGLLHLGHARTFLVAQQRALAAGGVLLLRIEDLDPQRSKPEFEQAAIEDLHWLGICWQGAAIRQSERVTHYREAWADLLRSGSVYPCACSRKDLAAAAGAPHESPEDAEPLYPGTCRRVLSAEEIADWIERGPSGANWRFRVPDGEALAFRDNNPRFGEQSYVAGRDFGDFAVWRRDDVPAYQLACMVDDAATRITEVVRGADLLLSTARQILLQRALHLPTPQYCHCELVRDEHGQRLSKRHHALSIRSLREQGWTPEQVLRGEPQETPSS